MFISFEGTEGVGKTTLIRSIYDDFMAQGKDVMLTRVSITSLPWAIKSS